MLAGEGFQWRIPVSGSCWTSWFISKPAYLASLAMSREVCRGSGMCGLEILSFLVGKQIPFWDILAQCFNAALQTSRRLCRRFWLWVRGVIYVGSSVASLLRRTLVLMVVHLMRIILVDHNRVDIGGAKIFFPSFWTGWEEWQPGALRGFLVVDAGVGAQYLFAVILFVYKHCAKPCFPECGKNQTDNGFFEGGSNPVSAQATLKAAVGFLFAAPCCHSVSHSPSSVGFGILLFQP